MSGDNRPFPGNGYARAVKFAEIFFDVVAGDFDPGLGVSDPGLRLDVVLAG